MIIGLLVAASAVWGQSSLSFYAEAGIGTSRLYGRHSGSDTQTSYKAGVGAEYTLNRTWALQSALEFISIGGKDDMQYVEHAKMHELYLQIPVMVAARLPLGENYHASLGLGPYIARCRRKDIRQHQTGLRPQRSRRLLPLPDKHIRQCIGE